MLQQAIEEKNLDKVKELLIEEPNRIDEVLSGGAPVCLYAAKAGNFAIVKYIVEY